MCHGDIGLITFQWSPNSLIPVANATTHECVNWKKIDEWTKARTVDMMKPGYLVHPTLGTYSQTSSSIYKLKQANFLVLHIGPAFPDGTGDPIGAMKAPQEAPHLGGHH